MGCHLSLTSLAQYKQISVPLAIGLAEEDDQVRAVVASLSIRHIADDAVQMPPAFVKKVREVMKGKSVPFETLQTEGTSACAAYRLMTDILKARTVHGYAARPNLELPQIKKAFDDTNGASHELI